MKKFISVILALVMVLSFCTVAFAANGDMTMTYVPTSGSTVTFANASYSWPDNNNATWYGYATYAQLPSGANLAALPVRITYTGTSLKVNGVEVSTNGTTYTGTIDLANGLATVEVISADGSRVYYAAANTTTSFNVSVQIEYDNLVTLSNMTANTAYIGARTGATQCPYLSLVTEDEITNAAAAVAAFSDAELGVVPTTATNYTVVSGKAAMHVLNRLASDNGLTIMDDKYDFISDSMLYVDSISGVDKTYSPQYSHYGYGGNAGGWMFGVKRGNSVVKYANISAAYLYLMAGDIVTFSYTCDLGYDLSYPMM